MGVEFVLKKGDTIEFNTRSGAMKVTDSITCPEHVPMTSGKRSDISDAAVQRVRETLDELDRKDRERQCIEVQQREARRQAAAAAAEREARIRAAGSRRSNLHRAASGPEERTLDQWYDYHMSLGYGILESERKAKEQYDKWRNRREARAGKVNPIRTYTRYDSASGNYVTERY